jgi:hypothetical protein
LRASAALRLLIAGLGAGSRIGTRCQGVNPLPFWHTIGVGSAGLVWATAAIGSTLATATLAAVIALTTLPTFAVTSWSVSACLGDWCIGSRHRGLWQVHAVIGGRLAVGVHTVALAWPGAFATSSATPSATPFAPAFTATTPTIGAGFTPTLRARLSAACAIPATAVALVVLGGLDSRLGCGD